MSSTAISIPASLRTAAPRVAVSVGGFLAGFGPVAVLGFDNGGYEVAAVAGLGVVLWWLLLVGILTGVIPRPRPTHAGTALLCALLGLGVLATISLAWSASPERGLTEVVRIVVYGGALLLGLAAVAAGQVRPLVGGVLAAMTLLAAAGVLARLQPDMFPGSSAVADGLGETKRLSWPLNYWNGMGALAGVAIPLALATAVRNRSAAASAASAAAIPVLALCLVLTLSRGGVAAAAVGLATAIAVVAPRLVLLRTALAPGVGAGIVIVATLGKDPVRESVGGAAQTDAGSSLLPLLVLVLVGVALAQAGWHLADRTRLTPRLPRPTRNAGIAIGVATLLCVVAGATAFDVPGRASNAWNEFKAPELGALRTQAGSVRRLTEINGAGRYEEWSKAIEAFRENPVGGIGLGSWEAWFNPRRRDSPPVRNAHSQPLEMAAELGVGGLALFVAIMLLPIAGGARLLRRHSGKTPFSIVALPSAAGFVVCLSVDWSWQLSCIPVAMALVCAALVGRDTSVPEAVDVREEPDRAPSVVVKSGRRMFAPVATAVVAVGCLGILAVAMIAPRGVADSRAALASGAAQHAVSKAGQTERAAPFSLDAATQQALAAEQSGDLAVAAAAALRATEIEPRNWRPWMVLARIETARNRPESAVAAYRRARALNPRSPLLNPQVPVPAP